ncbi:MAG: MATE family efflux transporter [Oscillospiraceae bacterium]
MLLKRGPEKNVCLTEGPIVKGIIKFVIPLFLGQLLQQLYNVADAWVVGNFANNDAFAAVSSGGNLSFLVLGLFSGISIGGGVVISRYYGEGDEKKIRASVHTNFAFAVLLSIASTVLGLVILPYVLRWMNTPESVMPYSLTYFRIYFGGMFTIIMYNFCMSIMRALGDSMHPLYYLIVSTCVNIVLDLLLVAVFHWGVAGAAIATVAAQGLSVVLCIIRMLRAKDYSHISIRELRLDKKLVKQVIYQGMPTGIQNCVISIGNLVVQTNINYFGSCAMSGVGAYSKIEGFAFLPITSISMALPTIISQNLGAKKYDRAKKSAAFGIISAVVMAELIGIAFFMFAPQALRIFIDDAESISYGVIHAHTNALFYCLLAFSHSAAGVMRGCGKSIVPMFTMLATWCGIRILYVTIAMKFFPVYQTVAIAYALTWSLSSIVFAFFLFKSDWTHSTDRLI